MIFSDPDQAVRACLIADERACAPARSIAAHGRHYDYLCHRCKRHKMVERYSRSDKGLIMRCAHCWAPRNWSDAYVMGGHAYSGRGGSPPRSMLNAADLAIVKAILIELQDTQELPVGFGRLYMAWVASGESQEWIARHATVWGLEDRCWTEGNARSAIRRSRSWLTRELKEKRLLVNRRRSRGREWASPC